VQIRKRSNTDYRPGHGAVLLQELIQQPESSMSLVRAE